MNLKILALCGVASICGGAAPASAMMGMGAGSGDYLACGFYWEPIMSTADGGTESGWVQTCHLRSYDQDIGPSNDNDDKGPYHTQPGSPPPSTLQ